MSVYTRAIINWTGTKFDLEETFKPQFDQYGYVCKLVGHDLYYIGHPECDIFELAEHFKRVSKHKKCIEIYHREAYIKESY
jgi:hypothetical protein